MQLCQTLAREIDVKAGKSGILLFDKVTRSGTKYWGSRLTNVDGAAEFDAARAA